MDHLQEDADNKFVDETTDISFLNEITSHQSETIKRADAKWISLQIDEIFSRYILRFILHDRILPRKLVASLL